MSILREIFTKIHFGLTQICIYIIYIAQFILLYSL